MMGYTWLGAMTGAWISYGARKFQLEFEDMSLIEKDMVEPTIRLIYIGVCSLIFELFLSCGVATITVGKDVYKRQAFALCMKKMSDLL